ncbi:MAG: hypothetical protein AVDCRST_MAG10-2166, partial [uncultured Acidimicrobiales bacterium]
ASEAALVRPHPRGHHHGGLRRRPPPGDLAAGEGGARSARPHVGAGDAGLRRRAVPLHARARGVGGAVPHAARTVRADAQVARSKRLSAPGRVRPSPWSGHGGALGAGLALRVVAAHQAGRPAGRPDEGEGAPCAPGARERLEVQDRRPGDRGLPGDAEPVQPAGHRGREDGSGGHAHHRPPAGPLARRHLAEGHCGGRRRLRHRAGRAGVARRSPRDRSPLGAGRLRHLGHRRRTGPRPPCARTGGRAVAPHLGGGM